jgi:hypothetical protein
MSRQKPWKVDGVDYTPEGIESVRGALVQRRERALVVEDFDGAMVLSHALVLLHYLKEWTEYADAESASEHTGATVGGTGDGGGDGSTDVPREAEAV